MMKHRWVFLIVVLQVALMSIAVAQQAPFDTVIRGGRLLDGTGAPWIRADIAIRGDRIAAIGGLDGVAARRTIHLRDEGAGLVKAVQEAITIGERAGLPAEIFHFKAVGSMRGRILEAVRLIEDARSRGIEVAANQYPYVASSTGLAARGIPPWVQEGGRQKMIERLKDPKVRERIRAEMASGLPGWESINDLSGFENIRVSRVRSERNKKYEGQSVAAIAKDRGTAPEDTLMDLLVEEEGNVSALYFIMTEEDVKEAMKLPWVSIGSDGTAVRPDGVLGHGRPHPRWYGTFPRVLGKYVHEEKVLTLEEYDSKMTSLTVAHLG